MNYKFIPAVLDIYDYENIHEMIFESIPRSYNVPSIFSSLSQLSQIPDKTKITVFGYIDDYSIKPFNRSLSMIKAKLYKDGESISVQWIIASQMVKKVVFALESKSKNNQLVQVSGKLNSFETPTSIFKYIESPILNSVDKPDVNNQAVVVPEPLYNLTEGIKALQVQNAFRELIKYYDDIDKTDFLPLELEKEFNLRPLKESLTFAHGLKPIPIEKFTAFLEYTGYTKRISIEKVWRIMKDGFESYSQKEFDGQFISPNAINFIKEISEQIPFELTNDQKKAIWNTLKSFSERKLSNNLIFGDVGSGKTIVALVVSYVLMKLGYQVAIIAPTSILAKQHFEEAKRMIGDNVFIVHSKTTKKEKESVNNILQKSIPSIIYGTSSVNKLLFNNLVAVFIDEEQKFGVHDKEILKKTFHTHSVLMTATPIPRTLAATMFTNYNIMKIEEKPAMQKPRLTKMINNLSDEDKLLIKNNVKNGEQALVIVPAIASNDMISSASAEIKYKKLFPDFKIGIINGRMKPANIEKTTEDFMSGKLDLLIATTMVDSGFSNKNLSFVFIESADRFGISQLHQIRGRVGRAEKQGYCYLIPGGSINSLKDKTKSRMQSLLDSENGFELSMKDIELRGSGDLRGNEQSGSDINMIEWINEINVINSYLKK